MTVYMPTVDATQLAELRADLDQLTRPITVPVRQRTRRTGTRWTAITHPPLLDQLRRAADGQNRTIRGPERRQTPRSRPPINVDALDRLSAVYVGIAGWHSGLGLPSPQQRTGLRSAGCPHRRRLGTVAPSDLLRGVRRGLPRPRERDADLRRRA